MEVSIEQFQTQCLEIMDDVQKHHHEIVITKRGKPIARLTPIADESEGKGAFGYLKGTVVIHDDIVKPVGEKWAADE